jgi:hypothetical protein
VCDRVEEPHLIPEIHRHVGVSGSSIVSSPKAASPSGCATPPVLAAALLEEGSRAAESGGTTVELPLSAGAAVGMPNGMAAAIAGSAIALSRTVPLGSSCSS